MTGLMTALDVTKGAYFWDCGDLPINSHYLIWGLKFSNPGHNLWDLKETSGSKQLITTRAIDKTTFSKYENQAKKWSIIIYIIILITIFCISACKKKSEVFAFDRSKKKELTNVADNKRDKYCFKIVRNRLKTHLLDKNKTHSYYFIISKEELLQNSVLKEKDYFKSIEKFYQDTFFSESYILEQHNVQYLILIGQSRGATGIGVDYWSYECYGLNDENKIIRFSSLSKTPYSVFFDNEKLEYITVDDNYPRPASGPVKLNYYPVIGSLYSEKGSLFKQIEYDCKNR